MSVIAGAPVPFRTMGVAPVAPALGAEITGVDLQRPIIGQQAVDLREALTRHLVLFFREQDVTEEQQLAVASVFGPPVSASLDPAEDLMFVTLEDGPDSPPQSDRWHTDVPFVPEPPDVAVLSMRTAPPLGGDTMWASLYGAYDSLSPPMQEVVARPGAGARPRALGRRDRPPVRRGGTARGGAALRTGASAIGARASGVGPTRAVPLRCVHARHRRHARRRERRVPGAPPRPARRSESAVPMAMARARRRHLGRTLHQPPRPLRPLPRAPRGAPLPRRSRPPGRTGGAIRPMTLGEFPTWLPVGSAAAEPVDVFGLLPAGEEQLRHLAASLWRRRRRPRHARVVLAIRIDAR